MKETLFFTGTGLLLLAISLLISSYLEKKAKRRRKIETEICSSYIQILYQAACNYLENNSHIWPVKESLSPPQEQMVHEKSDRFFQADEHQGQAPIPGDSQFFLSTDEVMSHSIHPLEIKCPGGGNYRITVLPDGKPYVGCSIHKNCSNPGALTSQRIIRFSFSKFLIWWLLIPFFIFLFSGQQKNIAEYNLQLCISNMKNLQTAAELYIMDHAPENVIPSIDTLVREGYLGLSPSCPSSGIYMLSFRTNPAPTLIVSCDRHGSLEKPHEAPNEKQLTSSHKKLLLSGLYYIPLLVFTFIFPLRAVSIRNQYTC